jgi:hypothetical protein
MAIDVVTADGDLIHANASKTLASTGLPVELGVEFLVLSHGFTSVSIHCREGS